MNNHQPHSPQRILIVSGGFYPSISPRAFRTTELARELARQGHRVSVAIPYGDRSCREFALANDLEVLNLGEPDWKPVPLKGKGASLMARRMIRRGMELLFEYPGIQLMFKTARFLRNHNRYDLLISVAVPYPIHWGAALARRKRRDFPSTWVADCGDPYMGETTDSFRKFFWFKYVEKYFCRKADFISIPFEGARPAYYPEFQEKLRIIPQGFRLAELKLPAYRKNGGVPSFAYAGRFIAGRRDPGKLLRFLTGSGRDFRFIVYTSDVHLVAPFKKALDGKLEIRDLVPREELLRVLSGMDFLVNFDNNTPTQLPSKLIDYAITGRPVLNISAGTDPGVILEFLDGNYSNRMNLEPGENYDIGRVAGKFLELSEISR